jgi:cold-inducible RNA-binding protein
MTDQSYNNDMSNSSSNGSNQSVNPRKMFVGNLSWNLTTEDLRDLFAEFGTVEDAVVLVNKMNGRSKGFGFVTMSTEEEAEAAIKALHQKNVDGRDLVVNVAQPPRPREDRGGFGGGRRDDRRGGGGYRDNRGGGDRRGGGYRD